MANLALCEEVQQMGRQGKLSYESQLLRSVLKYVRGDRPLKAILGFFANVELDKAPEDLTTVVFKALASSQNEGVWHRALYVLAEFPDQPIELPLAEVEKVLAQVICEARQNEVRVLASELRSQLKK